jgi:phosphate/sulfate permease
MTTNGMIAALNVAGAVVYLLLGLALLWQARRSLRGWPVSALIAIAGPYVLAGIALAQWTGWRAGDWPGEAFDATGLGTLALRFALVFVGVALLRRIVTGRLLTPGDHERVDTP